MLYRQLHFSENSCILGPCECYECQYVNQTLLLLPLFVLVISVAESNLMVTVPSPRIRRFLFPLSVRSLSIFCSNELSSFSQLDQGCFFGNKQMGNTILCSSNSPNSKGLKHCSLPPVIWFAFRP